MAQPHVLDRERWWLNEPTSAVQSSAEPTAAYQTAAKKSTAQAQTGTAKQTQKSLAQTADAGTEGGDVSAMRTLLRSGEATEDDVQRYMELMAAGKGTADAGTQAQTAAAVQPVDYTQENARLSQELAAVEPYQSRYTDEAARLYDEIMGRGNYQSAYADEIADLYRQAAGQTPYESPYEEQIRNLYDSLMNRPKFEYDANKDPLYQQYRDQYIRGGQQAMRDTMGSAAALAGGYGSSWGNTAGYQAYQQYLQGLNDRIPELSAAAYDRYQQEGDDLRQGLSTALALDEQGYGRWQDENDRIRQKLSTALALDEQDYSRWQDETDALRQGYNAAFNAEQSDWQRYRDEVQALMDRMQFNADMRNTDYAYRQLLKQAALDAVTAAGVGAETSGILSGGSGSAGAAGGYFADPDWDEKEIKKYWDDLKKEKLKSQLSSGGILANGADAVDAVSMAAPTTSYGKTKVRKYDDPDFEKAINGY